MGTGGRYPNSVNPGHIIFFKPRSPTINDPLQPWHGMGGLEDPVAIMVFPSPPLFALPNEHVILLPFAAHDRDERSFLLDIVDSKAGQWSTAERVAVRGTRLTPRGIATPRGFCLYRLYLSCLFVSSCLFGLMAFWRTRMYCQRWCLFQEMPRRLPRPGKSF